MTGSEQTQCAPALPFNPQPKPHRCPVCFGKGQVQNGFYNFPGVTTYPATSTLPEKCRSCGGRGIVFA